MRCRTDFGWANHHLAALSPEVQGRLFPHLQLVPLPLRALLYESLVQRAGFAYRLPRPRCYGVVRKETDLLLDYLPQRQVIKNTDAIPTATIQAA